MFKNLNSGKMMGNVKENAGLYCLNSGPDSIDHPQQISTCFESVFVLSNNDDNLSWNLRLGHHSF